VSILDDPMLNRNSRSGCITIYSLFDMPRKVVFTCTECTACERLAVMEYQYSIPTTDICVYLISIL